MQLWHTGPQSMAPIGPSPMSSKDPATMVREATAEDIASIVADFARTAVAAVQQCGFDAVEIHGAHGYFVDAFCSPTFNRRTDRYGGATAAARATLAGEVTRAVRQALGPRVPVIFRFSQWTVADYHHVKFHTPGDLLQFVAVVVDAGATALHVSTRGALDPGFPQVDASKSLAEWTKDCCREIGHPEIDVIAVGGVSLARSFGERMDGQDAFQVKDPAPSLRLVETGAVEFIALGRALLSNPDWGIKVQQGKWQSLIPYSPEVLRVLA